MPPAPPEASRRDALFHETGFFNAIEIDGPQHLVDPTTYRRDRRKDALLQESGFLVLRFLIEYLGKHLDATLDAILRIVAHQQRLSRESVSRH